MAMGVTVTAEGVTVTEPPTSGTYERQSATWWMVSPQAIENAPRETRRAPIVQLLRLIVARGPQIAKPPRKPAIRPLVAANSVSI